MDAELRKKVEERAYALWDEAGRPDASALLYWLRAEQEFGIVPKVQADDPLVTLQELATEAHALKESESAPSEGPLQDSVDKAVPTAERLESIAQRQAPLPGATTVEGGNKVPRRN